jgi:phosphoribosylanthranilate isomerase
MSLRVRVKICGITNREDAEAAIAAGADALGFNLWPGSKRHMVLDEHVAWMRELPPLVTKVAVLVNAPLEEALRVAAHPAIDLVQFHGDESPAYLAEFASLRGAFIAAVRLADAAQFPAIAALPTRNILIDAHVPGAFGGTGTVVNFPLASEFVRQHPGHRVLLAGGLIPENVEDAISRVRPFGVDVASGVEKSPGLKDYARMKAFFAAVQRRTAFLAN